MPPSVESEHQLWHSQKWKNPLLSISASQVALRAGKLHAEGKLGRALRRCIVISEKSRKGHEEKPSTNGATVEASADPAGSSGIGRNLGIVPDGGSSTFTSTNPQVWAMLQEGAQPWERPFPGQRAVPRAGWTMGTWYTWRPTDSTTPQTADLSQLARPC